MNNEEPEYEVLDPEEEEPEEDEDKPPFSIASMLEDLDLGKIAEDFSEDQEMLANRIEFIILVLQRAFPEICEQVRNQFKTDRRAFFYIEEPEETEESESK